MAHPHLHSDFRSVPGARAAGWRLMAAAMLAALAAAAGSPARSDDAASMAAAGRRLVAAYPDHLERVDGGEIVWRDGTRMAIGNIADRLPAETIAAPTLADMFRWPYPAGVPAAVPPPGHDPGRARHRAFFDRMYGDCTRGGVAASLVDVEWLPQKRGGKVRVTRINGVAGRLAAVSRELDRLPRTFDRFLVPSAGAYACRPIAGTRRPSAHGYGIAIDIAIAPSSYWRWHGAAGGTAPRWRNRIPMEIVAIFERHGFIWGGRWSHYDTMHFEYRPELLPETVR